MTTIKETQPGHSYWSQNGAYQKEYNELWDQMIPATGRANTLTGELIRSASKLAYEFWNNGNCNACDITYYEDEWEEEQEEYNISEYYANFLELISKTLQTEDPAIIEITSKVEGIILEAGFARSTEYTDKVYNSLLDHVIAYALEHLGKNDSEIPTWYENDKK